MTAFIRIGIVILLWSGIEISSYAQVLKEVNVVKIAQGFQFVEGPAWHPTIGLLFSDIPGNRIYRYTPSGTVVWLEPSGNSNGLMFDAAGNLILAQHGPRQVSKLIMPDSLVVLATHYDGKRLNSPNDIAIHPDGSIFFTDPPYGLIGQGEIGFSGIYRLNPSGDVQLLDNTLHRPNGIAFSPDYSKLYVSNAEEVKVYVWDVIEDTTIANKTLFFDMNTTACCADGLKVDSLGFVYATAPNGIRVINPNGSLAKNIPIPEKPANCAFGGVNSDTLYVTANKAVYRVSNKPPVLNALPEAKANTSLEVFLMNDRSLRISLHGERPEKGCLELLNLEGRVFHTWGSSELETLNYQVFYDVSHLPTGLYLVRHTNSKLSLPSKVAIFNP